MKRWFAAVGALAIVTSLIVLSSAQVGNRQWRMQSSSNDSSVQFTVERSRAGGRWVASSDYPLERFQGLSADVLKGGRARFEFVHDAGRLVCEGSFTLHKGSGTFEFVPNAQFAVELERLGYGNVREDQMFSMMMSDVGLEFARVVKQAGIVATARELVEMRTHDVTRDYIRDLRATGYNGLSVSDYIQFRIHGVTADLVTELKEAGYVIPAKEIVQMRIHGVSPEFIRDLHAFGLRPSSSEIVEMRIHGVQPEYLKGMKDAGQADLGVREIVNMKIHGVAPDFALEARNLGYRFTPKELTHMRMNGVDNAYLRRLKESGYHNLDAEKIVKLRIHGID